MFNPVAPFRYLLPNLYFSVADIVNPVLFACGSRTWISLDITRFYEEHCQPIQWVRMAGLPENGNRAPIAWGGRGRHNLHRVCQTAVTAPPRVGCVVWSRYHHSLYPITHGTPSLTVTITRCYHYSLLQSLTVTITHCYHYLLLPLLIVTITHC